MRIERLHLQNFRGFAEVEFDFRQSGNLVVLVGKNGAGKSSVLDCIAVFFARFALSVQEPAMGMVLPLRPSSIRRGAKSLRAAIAYQIENSPDLQWRDAFSLGGNGDDAADSELVEYARRHLLPLANDKNASVPLLFHYPAETVFTVFGASPPNILSTHDESAALRPQIRAYSISVEADAANQFQTFLKWFRAQEDIENQTRLRKDMSFRSKQLDPVRTAIERFMQALPGNANFRNLRVEREAVEKESALFKVSERISYVIDKDQETFDLTQLSDGERSTLLLVADIAMRLVIANPAAFNPLQGTGIVLVDEIERHLHPGWQRAILGGLAATFPNLQFIVTTHSPQVLSKVPRASVFLLDRFQLAAGTPHTYGRDSNALLEDVLGVSERPDEAMEKIREIGVLLDSEQIELARNKLEELEAWLGENDAEIVRLRRLIDFCA